jgi:hypothetical protein
MLFISGPSGLPFARYVRKQLWSTFFPIPLIVGVAFDRCDGSSGCMCKRLGIGLASNPVLGEEGKTAGIGPSLRPANSYSLQPR